MNKNFHKYLINISIIAISMFLSFLKLATYNMDYESSKLIKKKEDK